MARDIPVSQQIYNDLEELAVPFVDREPQDVIKRLIDHWRSSATALPKQDLAGEKIKIFAPESPPDLTFTRVKAFTMDGEPVVEKAALYWNPILFAIVARAARKLSTVQLKKSLVVNYVDGEGQQNRGYRYIKDAGLSVQGSDANTVWRAIFELVKAIDMKIEVEFAWEDKPRAAFPNTTGRFNYNQK
jgi:hypothetical protein